MGTKRSAAAKGPGRAPTFGYSAFYAIAKKEFAGVFKERTILLAVFIQVFVAGFSSLLVVGLSALVDPSAIPNYTNPDIATDSPGDLTRMLQNEGMNVVEVPDRDVGLQMFVNGDVDAFLHVDIPDDPTGTINVELILPDADMFATLTLVQVKDVLEDYERQLRDERDARLVHEPLYVDAASETSQYAFVYSLLIPLLVFLPIILSGGLMADSMTEEMQRGTFPLLLVSPATVADIVGGKLVANTMITPLLSFAWLGLLWLNGFVLSVDAAAIIVVFSTAMAFLSGLVAAGVSLIVRDRDRAQVLYAVVFFLIAGLSLLAPTSPVNAISLLAAGSAHMGVYIVVVITVALCVVGWTGLQLGLDRAGRHLASASKE